MEEAVEWASCAKRRSPSSRPAAELRDAASKAPSWQDKVSLCLSADCSCAQGDPAMAFRMEGPRLRPVEPQSWIGR